MREMIRKVNEVGQTAGKQGNEKRLQERRNRLTDSNFGAVCRTQNTTSQNSTVQNLLQSTFKGYPVRAYELSQEVETGGS